MKKKVLLHTCCAPCATALNEWFKDNSFQVEGFWYNPNIHPYREYGRRLETLREYASKTDFTVHYKDDYDLEGFISRAFGKDEKRCYHCFKMRLGKAARFAAENNFPLFSTTLLISPYQDVELLKKAGEEAAGEAGVEFYFEDFRPLYKISVELSRSLGLYRQPYCGCIFSEKDRYLTA